MGKIAAVQMASGSHVTANIMEAARLVTEAVALGAEVVVLPESFAFLGADEKSRTKIAEPPGSGLIQDELREIALKQQVWLIAGTIPLTSNDPRRAYASSLVYNSQGEQVARYDKIHLFDVQIDETSETYFESEATMPGTETVVVDTPVGKIGMGVCYDLRFPGHFRSLVEKGAEIFVLPSAFTETTGQAHWEILLRARAIENLCYMIAPAQGGFHLNGRRTYGHSMIIDYWGAIQEELGKGFGMIVSDVNLKRLHTTRKAFPVLEHRLGKADLPPCRAVT